jgi:6-pyruvoyltetrahydropterin/6-carboxytetrahydropterin synthase
VNYDGKCRYLHGHNGRLEVDVESDSLDDLGMVVDFGEVRDVVKGWIDSELDHRMILCERDPLLATLKDAGEPLYVMAENPTAENIAKHVFDVARDSGLNVTEVRLWETPSSYATYGLGDTEPQSAR